MKKHKFIEQTDDGFIYYSKLSNKCYKLKNIEELNELFNEYNYFMGFLPIVIFFLFFTYFFLENAMTLDNLLYMSSCFIIITILFLIIGLILGIREEKKLNKKYEIFYLKNNKKAYFKHFFFAYIIICVLFFGFYIMKDFIHYSDQLDFENQKFEKIINRNSFVLKINPKYEESLFSRFVAHSSLEEYDKALIDINKLLTIRPQNEYYISNKAQLLYEMGRIDEAFELLNSEIEKNPKDIFYNERSDIYFKEGKLDEALSDLQKIKPEKYPIYEYKITNGDKRLLKMAEIYEAKGDYCSALDSYNKLEYKYIKNSLYLGNIKNAERKCKR